MRAVFVDQHQATRLDRSGMKAFHKDFRGPDLNTSLKPLDGHAAIKAFDERLAKLGYDGEHTPKRSHHKDDADKKPA